MISRNRKKAQTGISEEDLNWVKETLARLLIENGVLRLVTAHLIVAKCKETDDPLFTLRDLHRALDAAANLVIEGDKLPGLQRLVELYQPKIDELIQVANKLLSVRPRQP